MIFDRSFQQDMDTAPPMSLIVKAEKKGSILFVIRQSAYLADATTLCSRQPCPEAAMLACYSIRGTPYIIINFAMGVDICGLLAFRSKWNKDHEAD